MPDVYNIHEAKTHLSKLLASASAGKEIRIAKAGVERWKIVPIDEEKPKRTPGKLKGKIWYSDDCWDPMSEEELKEWYGVSRNGDALPKKIFNEFYSGVESRSKSKKKIKRVPGAGKGKIWIAHDAFSPEVDAEIAADFHASEIFPPEDGRG